MDGMMDGCMADFSTFQKFYERVIMVSIYIFNCLFHWPFNIVVWSGCET